ncbi:putative polysaccharide biosynthesis protein [Calidifontibacillus erzurumensis]|uniref:putative polysaccharide biosynthesis protein n=1 Tax=Calidifontibacillus erzurumensis TaxID=2741433 RepID=UPI0035B510E5
MNADQSFTGKNILKSALLLTIVGIIIKVLSAVYRIPFQNIVGDIGYYIYQQVYPFYGVAFILSTYGFPVVISKLIAELTPTNKAEARKVLFVSFIFLSLLFIALFFIFYTYAEKIASLMGDEHLTLPIKTVAFTYLFVPIMSVIRGYFQGHNNMRPTAISQFVDQFVRVVTILLITYFLVAYGQSIYTTAAGAVAGSIAGACCGAIILCFYWLKRKKDEPQQSTKRNVMKYTSLSIIKTLSRDGLTICISSLLLILLQLADSMTLYSQLVKSELFSATDAKIAKGIFDRGQPLIQLGTVLAASMSLTVVPLISSAKVRADFQNIKEKVDLSFRICIIAGVGASLGLMAIIKPANLMLYTDMNGSYVLAILACTIIFCSLALTAAGVIQGLGSCIIPALCIIIGVICKLFLNYMFVPLFGTYGAASATVLASLVIAMLLIKHLSNMVEIQSLKSYFIKALLAGAWMVCCLIGYQILFHKLFGISLTTDRFLASVETLTAIFLGAWVYLYSILKMGIFTESELRMLPFGEKFVFIMKRKERRLLKEE